MEVLITAFIPISTYATVWVQRITCAALGSLKDTIVYIQHGSVQSITRDQNYPRAPLSNFPKSTVETKTTTWSANNA